MSDEHPNDEDRMLLAQIRARAVVGGLVRLLEESPEGFMGPGQQKAAEAARDALIDARRRKSW